MMLIEACLLLIVLTVALFGEETAYKSLEETSRTIYASKERPLS
jgi:hypothetical protein